MIIKLVRPSHFQTIRSYNSYYCLFFFLFYMFARNDSAFYQGLLEFLFVCYNIHCSVLVSFFVEWLVESRWIWAKSICKSFRGHSYSFSYLLQPQYIGDILNVTKEIFKVFSLNKVTLLTVKFWQVSGNLFRYSIRLLCTDSEDRWRRLWWSRNSAPGRSLCFS